MFNTNRNFQEQLVIGLLDVWIGLKDGTTRVSLFEFRDMGNREGGCAIAMKGEFGRGTNKLLVPVLVPVLVPLFFVYFQYLISIRD